LLRIGKIYATQISESTAVARLGSPIDTP